MRAFSPLRYEAFSYSTKTDHMAAIPPAVRARGEPPTSTTSGSRRSERSLELLTGGGTDGNKQLTAMTGTVLIVLLAVIGVTILQKSQLISVHLFVGLLLIGPVTLKMASTGYRFARYYTHDRVYRRKGPPPFPLRAIAPVVVGSTVLVFASGIVLLFEGPSHRGSWVAIHKASFLVWLIFTGLHVLGHLPGMPASLRAASRQRAQIGGLAQGSVGRWITLLGVCAGGVVLALLLMPQFAAWTAPGAFAHHH
jgi:hypothetical protein